MSDLRIESWMRVQRLSPGRRLVALRRMAEGALGLSVEGMLMPLIDQAIEAQEEGLAQEEAWRLCKDNDAMHAPGAKALDAALDRSVSGLYRVLADLAGLFEAEAPLAQKILDQVFADGVSALTTLPYVEEHAAVQALTERLRASFTPELQALQLERWVCRIETLNRDYGGLLTRPREMTGQQLKDADTQGYIRLLGVVAAVLGLFPSNSEHDLEGRRLLLQPLLDQQNEASQLRARRKERSARPPRPTYPLRYWTNPSAA